MSLEQKNKLLEIIESDNLQEYKKVEKDILDYPDEYYAIIFMSDNIIYYRIQNNMFLYNSIIQDETLLFLLVSSKNIDKYLSYFIANMSMDVVQHTNNKDQNFLFTLLDYEALETARKILHPNTFRKMIQHRDKYGHTPIFYIQNEELNEYYVRYIEENLHKVPMNPTKYKQWCARIHVLNLAEKRYITRYLNGDNPMS